MYTVGRLLSTIILPYPRQTELCVVRTVFTRKKFFNHSIKFHLIKKLYAHYYYYNPVSRLTALVQDYPGEPVPERYNQSGFY